MIQSHQVIVAVATYKRTDLLTELLDSLATASTISPFSVVVVDNDPEGGARITCQRGDLVVSYLHEPTPGIAAARNCALGFLNEDHEAIAFVDDDETVDPLWMKNLLHTLNTLHADVVSGPVISVFPAGTARWIIDGGFHQRIRFQTNTTITSAATNNTILRTSFLKRLNNPRFDETFSMTGGSDTEFFSRVQGAGGFMAWCDEALVWERVPAERLTLKWIWRRGVRIGNVTGRLKLRRHSKLGLLGGAVVRIAYGSARASISTIKGKGLQAIDLDYIVRGVGWVGAITNNLVQEYERTPQVKRRESRLLKSKLHQ
ncbi:glycosyltransferase family 2 protein [Pseudarthrobacter scleromae]|uniref:glycosyltransferase family 2 protein n=1 Tax=Pseudarthrobacter scleromae TaxID=158897 RepID=UPI003CFCC096